MLEKRRRIPNTAGYKIVITDESGGIISRDISADILAHWMDLLNSEGWIPR
jgi:hypothetical protein